MIEKLLVDKIAEENGYRIISTLDNSTKEYLKKHIQTSILEIYKYPHIEILNEMILNAIELYLEDTLYAINYIETINYRIDDTFYKKLEEPYFDSMDDTICDWENEFEKNKKDIRLNRYTLGDFITFEYIDSVNMVVNSFESDEDFLKDFYGSSTLELANSAIIKFEEEYQRDLTKREKLVIKAFAMETMQKQLKISLKYEILENYNPNNNLPETNQTLLNDSYDAIINELEKLSNTSEIIDIIITEKSNNNDLFTNRKKLAKLKSNNHYMSFLYKCEAVYSGYETIVFKEFVEGLVSGYMQYLELVNSELNLKQYKQDLEVLQKYNKENENDRNIDELETMISFLSTAKPQHKFIPFKELSNRLEIDTNSMTNYITNTLNNSTHKYTIKKHFDTLVTIPKEICISKF